MKSTSIIRGRLPRLAAGLACAALLATTAVAQAADPMAGLAASSLGLGDSVSGRIEAGGGSRLAYYNFEFPGGSSMVNLTLQDAGSGLLPFSSASGTSMPGTQRDVNWGFNVFGPNGVMVAHGAASGSSMPNAGATLSDIARGTYVVEVFNSDASVAMNFELTKTMLTSERFETYTGSPESGLSAPMTSAVVAPD